MGSSATVCTRGVRVCAMAAAARGLDITPIVVAHGVAPETVQDPYARVPHALMCALWEQVPAQLGDPNFGLHAAELAQAVAFDAVDYASSHCATAREGIGVMVRYVPLLHDASTAGIESDGDTTRYVQRFDVEPTIPRHLGEFILARWVLRVRRNVGPEAPLRAVGFMNGKPDDLREHERVLGLPLRFGQEELTLEFATAMLDMPLREANPAVGELMRRHLDELAKGLATQPTEPEVLSAARKVIIDALPSGPPTVARVARKLGQSTRSLQRRLQGAETSFQALLDETRRELALRHLRNPSLALTEVAFLTGFADASAFHHAFRRWTRSTPREYRLQSQQR